MATDISRIQRRCRRIKFKSSIRSMRRRQDADNKSLIGIVYLCKRVQSGRTLNFADCLTDVGSALESIRKVRDVGGMAGTQGFEPRYAAPEAAVLPLDDVPIRAKPYFTRHGAANPPWQSSKLEDHDEALVAGVRPAVPVRLGRLGRRLDSP